ncbi:MAG TPA: hypothetical protein DGO43_04580 [Chloroflexi bacterium]|nr:hypothetical protein [Chloroflexota bacterium]|tara:strand:- start:3747 stop:6119 length:2373 start_codon:yes stop_codon:yes gene_type:complete
MIPLVLFFAVLGWHFNRPIPDSSAYPLGDIDQLFLLATLEWERASLLHHPQKFFQGLSFYGMGESLFFSDLLLGTLPIYMVLAPIFGPALGFNLLHVILPTLNGLLMFGALHQLTARSAAAIVGATVFAFSPIQMNFGQHFQLQMLMWTALMLWFLVLYVQTRKPWTLGAAAVTFTIQFSTAIYLGYFAALALAFLLVGAVLFGTLSLRNGRNIALSLTAASLGLLPLAPIIAGYQRFGDDWQITRDIREVARYSAELPGYLAHTTQEQWWMTIGTLGNARWASWPTPPIIVTAVLATLGIYAGIRRPNLRWVVFAGSGLTILGVVLSLGPELRWEGRLTGIEMPYRFLFDTFAEFRALRVAERFAIPAMLGITLLSTIGADAILRWAGSGKATRYVVPVGLGLLLAIELARGPTPTGKLPDRETLANRLATIQGPTIFVPAEISVWEEAIRLWVAAQAKTQIVNGYSGFNPPAYRQLTSLVDEAGADDIEQVIEALHAYGVRSLVLDTSRMSAGEASGWIQASMDRPGGRDPIAAEQFLLITLDGDETPPKQSRWENVTVSFYASSVPAGADLPVPVFVSNPRPKPWIPPEGPWARPTTITWTRKDGTLLSQSRETFRVPPVVPGHSGVKIDGPVRAVAPLEPGEYTLSLLVDGAVLATNQITVTTSTRPPNSLKQTAEVFLLHMSRTSLADWPATLRVAALNVGNKTWDGAYRVGYRWLQLGEDGFSKTAEVEGRLFFSKPIDPGTAEIVGGTIKTPKKPGHYLLEYGVVHEKKEWLSRASAGVTVGN